MTAHIPEPIDNIALPSDRATQATPQAHSGLGHPVSVTSADGWMPIDTAPESKGKYFFCRIAWGPDWDRCTGDAFRWNGRWFAAGVFYLANRSSIECQHEIRQIEVQPTHWLRNPAAPEGPAA